MDLAWSRPLAVAAAAVLLPVLAGAQVPATGAESEDVELAVEAGLEIRSAATYHGERLSRENASPVLAPRLAVTVGGHLALHGSGVFDLGTQDFAEPQASHVVLTSGRYDEETVGATLFWVTEDVELSLDARHTFLPGAEKGATAFEGTATLGVFGHPGFAVMREIGHAPGWFFKPSLAPVIELAEDWRLEGTVVAVYGSQVEPFGRALGRNQGTGLLRTTDAPRFSGWTSASASLHVAYDYGRLSAWAGLEYDRFLSDRYQQALGASDQENGVLAAVIGMTLQLD